jgi:hypothetical protein
MGGTGAGRSAIGFAAALLLLVLVPAASAKVIAAPPIGGATFGHAQTATATSVCPGKTKAVGGGFNMSVPSPAGYGVVYESQRAGKRGWRVSVQNYDPASFTTVVVTAYAYCERGAPKTSTRSVTRPTLAQDTFGSLAPVGCRSRAVRAGGFITDLPVTGLGTQGPRVTTAFAPQEQRWEVAGISSSSRSVNATAVAYCEKPAKKEPKEIKLRSATSGAVAGGLSTTVRAQCPAGSTPVAGGFAQNATAGAAGGSFVIQQSERIERSWQVTGVHVGAAPASLIAQAICG